jgi:hypothetical protein
VKSESKTVEELVRKFPHLKRDTRKRWCFSLEVTMSLLAGTTSAILLPAKGLCLRMKGTLPRAR